MMRPIRTHRRPLRHRRRGYTLVIFALLFFCLMAIGALVIDLGMARVTQQQMQTAVNSAALEGLRGDRVKASEFADLVFDHDDDLDISTDADPRWQELESARSNPQIDGRFIDIAQSFTYDPQTGTNLPHLRTNDSDAPDGDMSASPGPPASFFVQMRRIGYQQDDIRSIGPRLPYLFGRGSLLPRAVVGTNVEGGAGIAVRAESTAQAERAMAIGRRTLDAPVMLPGAYPFVIEAGRWAEVAGNTVFPLTIDGTALRLSSVQVGYLYDLDASDGLGMGFSLGEEAPGDQGAGSLGGDVVFWAAAERDGSGGSRFGFVPIVGSVNDSAERYVVGFGAIEMTTATPTTMSYSTLTDLVAPHNASAVMTRSLATAFSDSSPDPELADLIDQRSNLDSPLYAPALVR
jgi:hypothetical protein